MRVRLFSSALVTFVRNDQFEQCTGHGESFQSIAEDAWAGLHPDLPMPSESAVEVHMQDIQGPLALADSSGREPCIRCGMTANIDPSFHDERYAHRPIVRRQGQLWRFSYNTFAFTELVREE